MGAIALAVAALVLLMDDDEPRASETPGAETPARDPFEGLAREEPGGPGLPRSSASGEPAPIPSSEEWGEALAAAAEAKRELEEAAALRGKGDLAAYRAQAEEARKLYGRALELGAHWQQELLAQVDAESAQARKVERKLQDWSQELMALRKSAGL